MMRDSIRSLILRTSASARPLVVALSIFGSLGAASAVAQQPAPPATPAAEAADSTRISARGALIRSLVLPGWGQSYVGAPGRGAVYFALEAGSLWMAYKTVRALDSARRLETSLRESGQLGEEERFSLVESREEQREDWIALSVFWLLAAGADAYVAAQLAGFDEHIGVRPSGTGGIELQARVPVFGRR